MAAKGHFLQRFGILARLAPVAVGVVLTLALVVAPALAQYRRSSPFDSFFQPFSAPRYGPSERPVDSSRAPPPRKQDARQDSQPSTVVLVLGDSMADWLGYGLEDALSDAPEMSVVRKHRTVSGLIRYDTRNETHDWAQAAREAIAATKPNFVVMMIGSNDRQAIRVRPQAPSLVAPAAATPPAGTTAPAAGPPSATAATPPAGTPPETAQSQAPQQAETPLAQPAIIAPEPPTHTRAAMQTFEFRSEQWADEYVKRIDATITAMKSAGVPVFWVGLPSIRGPKSTGDMQYLDDLYRTRAEKAGITYIDIWDGFVDESGRFTLHGPDFEGQTRRLRTGDGVHFTKAGARKLAHFVEREIRRVMTRGVTTVALPSSEPTPSPVAKPGQPTPRPLSGPVLPLTAPATAQQDLAGGSGAPAKPPGQAMATRVLQKGEAIAPPAGRSDDFKWPRREIAPYGADPVVATTTDPLPVMHAAPATTVAVPNEESRAVAAAPTPRRTTGARSASQQQQQQRRSNNGFNIFPFFR